MALVNIFSDIASRWDDLQTAIEAGRHTTIPATMLGQALGHVIGWLFVAVWVYWWYTAFVNNDRCSKGYVRPSWADIMVNMYHKRQEPRGFPFLVWLLLGFCSYWLAVGGVGPMVGLVGVACYEIITYLGSDFKEVFVVLVVFLAIYATANVHYEWKR